MKTLKLIIVSVILIHLFIVISAAETEIKEILTNKEFLVGMGEDKDYEKADKKALANLISLISENVEVDLVVGEEETNGNVHEYVKKTIETYSSSILNNAQRSTHVLKSGNYKVYRYIKISEKDKVFEGRKNKIEQYIRNGLKNEDLNEIGNALQNYYWALILLKSHPDNKTIKYEFENEEQLLLGYLRTKIQTIMNSIKIETSNLNEGRKFYSYNVTALNHKGKIINLDLGYWDGENWIETNIKDGIGVIYISKEYSDCLASKQMNLKIDYEYKKFLGDIPQDEEVKSLIEYISYPFDNKKKLYLKGHSTKSSGIKFQNIHDKKLKNIVEEIINSIKIKNYSIIRDHFSDKGYLQFEKIMNYGDVSLYTGEHAIDFLEVGDQIQVRSIPLVFHLDDYNKKVIYDNIVLLYEKGKIQWVNFSLNDNAVNDAIRRGNDKDVNDLTQRMMAVNFMEFYRTIFSLKDINNIERIFADSALIFVGYIKRSEQDNSVNDINRQLSKDQVKYKKLTKDQYMSGLRNKVFRNKFVNIQFTGMDILRRYRKEPIFGIQLKQHHYSTNYSDTGHLLLFVDFYNVKEPKIFFRCWRPEKIDLSELEEMDDIDIFEFNF